VEKMGSSPWRATIKHGDVIETLIEFDNHGRIMDNAGS
jgi:hypothetical protein